MESNFVVMPRSKFMNILSVFGAILLVFICFMGYFSYKKLMEENSKLRGEVVEFKQLTNTLVRSSANWVTDSKLKESLKDMLKSGDLDALRKDIREQGARISAINNLVGSLQGVIAKLEKSDKEGVDNPDIKKCDDGRLVDIHGYTKKPQIKRLLDINAAPVADVEFNAVKDKPWSYEVFGKKIKLSTVVSQKDDGQLTFYHNLKYSVPKVDAKEYNIPISSSEVQQVKLGSKMHWLNIKMDLGAFLGGNAYPFAMGPGNPASAFSAGVDLGLSFSSYGETKLDSWWKFFRVGAGYDMKRNAGTFSFAPIMFNLGKVLPLITNLYVYPKIGVDTAGGLLITGGIGPQL